MAHPSAVRLIPDCRVSVDGKKLDVAMDARLTKVEVDLDVDLFGQCVLVFNDPAQALINGKEFQSGTPIKVEIGFGSKLKRVFEGEVVALEPQFRRDMAPSLRVVCQESLHRLALSQMTRAFNDVDDKEIVGKIATEHGLSGEAPAGSKQHVLQGNITDAVFLRRLAQKHGNHLRIEGKKLIIGPPPKGAQLKIGPGDGTRKVKVKIQSQDQVEEITVHGYDPKTKKEFVGKAKGQGVTGEGTQKYGKGKTLSFAGQEYQPADTATAEAMAKGRMRKLSEGHVTASIEAIGDPGMLPGATVTLEKLGAEIDGSYRVERAVHQFSKHGYYVNLKLVRTAKAKAPAPAKQTPPPPAPAPAPAPPEAAPPEPGGTGGTGAAAGTGGTGGAAGTGATAHGGTGSGGTGTAGTGTAGTGTGTGTGTAGTGTGTGTAGAGTGTGTAGTAATVAPAAGTKINFRFEPATGFCGDRVHVKAETENLADGTAVTITLRPRQGSSPRLATVAATVAGNRIDQEFEIANVDFGTGASALAQVEIEATSTNAAQITCATALQVRGRSDGASQHFSVNRTWGDAAKHQRFGANPRFDQKVEKYRNLVNVTADILKAWGGTYITFKRIAGTPAAPPAAGGRGCYGGYYWARNSTGVGMQPDQYHDGTNWVAMPAGFRPGAADYFSIAFYKDGSTYKVPGAATLRYPDAFADYEFDSETYTNIRAGWAQRVHDTWSDQWALRRSACKSDKSVNCCKYSVDVKLTLNKVEAWSDKVIMVGAGDFRNNMSTFFLDSNRPATVPHEIGHLMDNPDEYVDGAVDVTISGDGANNGIDDDSIMGLNKSKVKKRHYHAFADMLQKIMKTAYGNDEKHDTVDK